MAQPGGMAMVSPPGGQQRQTTVVGTTLPPYAPGIYSDHVLQGRSHGFLYMTTMWTGNIAS